MSNLRMKTLTATELLQREFPPARFVIPSVLPVGLTLLAGRPKLGKSWLALNAAAAVASGGVCLGRQAAHGDVLFLGLEDGPRRLQGRLQAMLGASPAPGRLSIATDCPTLDQGGEAEIRGWAQSVSQPRLIVVDVLQRIRPKGERGLRLYADDYAAALPLKVIADEFDLAVVAVTHTRKREAEDDPLDGVSSTTGLTGAADHVLILDRSTDGVTLYGRGRDVEEVQIALRFDPRTGTWLAIGDRDEVNRSDTRNAIAAALAAAGEPLGPSEIARRAGLKEEVVKVRIASMVKAGECLKLGHGKYACPRTPITVVTSDTLSPLQSNEGDGSNGDRRVA